MLEIFNTVFKYKEKQSPDQLGFYPERVHVNAMPERRYLWTSRVLVILACLSICLNMMLAATIYLLLPQRTVQPKLFQINKYFSMLEQVQPAEINFPVSDLITEQHITEYILLRYLVSSDYDELVTRWGPGSTIYWYSSPAVFREFSENDVAYSIMQFRQKSLQRRGNRLDQTGGFRPVAGTVPHNGLSARFRQTDHQHLAGYHAHYLCAYPVCQTRRRHCQSVRFSGAKLLAGLSRFFGIFRPLSGKSQTGNAGRIQTL